MKLGTEGQRTLEIGSLAAGQIVDHRDAIASGQQPIHKV